MITVEKRKVFRVAYILYSRSRPTLFVGIAGLRFPRIRRELAKTSFRAFSSSFYVTPIFEVGICRYSVIYRKNVFRFEFSTVHRLKCHLMMEFACRLKIW